MTSLEFDRAPEAVAQERRAPNRELTTIWKTAPGVRGILSSVDHKEIGLRYIITAFAFLIVGGLEALVMRIQLAHPNCNYFRRKPTISSLRCMALR